MAIIEIPIRTDIAAYDFKIDLDGTTYTLNFYYNDRFARWHFDILTDGLVPLVMGTPIHVKTDLIGRFKETNKTIPQGTFFAVNSTFENVEPMRDNFSTDVKLLYNEVT